MKSKEYIDGYGAGYKDCFSNRYLNIIREREMRKEEIAMGEEAEAAVEEIKTMTRKEAISKCHGVAYPDVFIQALEALGVLKFKEEENSYEEIEIINVLGKSGISYDLVKMELKRAGFKIVKA